MSLSTVDRIWFIGPPLCGKGKQVELLSHSGIIKVPNSQILRAKYPERIPDIEQGILLSDELVLPAVGEYYKTIPRGARTANDGLPRTIEQARWAIDISRGCRFAFIFIDVSRQTSHDRLAVRIAEEEDKGEDPRKDDDPVILDQRLDEYYRRKPGLVDFLDSAVPSSCVHFVNGERKISTIASEIQSHLSQASTTRIFV